MTLVSFVVPTKNSARTLEMCLESLRGQTHSDVEVVVVDNSSSDETCATLSPRFPNSPANSPIPPRLAAPSVSP